MKLPFRIFAGSPYSTGWRPAVRRWWLWTILAGIVAASVIALALAQRESAIGAERSAGALEVRSAPVDAAIEVDGHGRGRTPAIIPLAPGDHAVRLRQEGFFDAQYQVSILIRETTTLAAELWLRAPSVQRLRPAFPGATITGAGFLADGRVALTLALPPSDERQAWLLDGPASIRRSGPPEVPGALAIAPDGDRVAYLRHGAASIAGGVASSRFDEVWLSGRDGDRGERRYALPAEARDQGLLDLSWSLDGEHLLVVGRQRLPAGGQRTRLFWLDMARGDVRELARLPSEVVAGSYLWSPDGQRVAFLSRAGQITSLCVVGANGEFRYLADLSRDGPTSLPFAPLSWSPDGRRLVYAAPAQDRLNQTGWLFGTKAPASLFIVDDDRTLSRQIGTAEAQSPAWRHDGVIVALARPKSDRPLVLRAVDPDGVAEDLGPLPVKSTSSYAARWDLAHAQALIAVGASAGFGPAQPEYWLLRFRPEVGQ